MGADPEHGRRRGCSRECCQPNTRAQEREAVRDEILAALVVDAAEHDLYWLTAAPMETRDGR